MKLVFDGQFLGVQNERGECLFLHEFSSIVYSAESDFRRNKASKVIQQITQKRTYGVPISPKPFPKGTWNITGIEQWASAESRKNYGEWKINTDAFQLVDEWDLDAKGAYKNKTGAQVDDWGYAIHYSVFRTSLGCITTTNKRDFDKLLKLLRECLDAQEAVVLEVL
jgi:hypothetical protein